MSNCKLCGNPPTVSIVPWNTEWSWGDRAEVKCCGITVEGFDEEEALDKWEKLNE